jgi:ankyrin repeat protein
VIKYIRNNQKVKTLYQAKRQKILTNIEIAAKACGLVYFRHCYLSEKQDIDSVFLNPHTKNLVSKNGLPSKRRYGYMPITYLFQAIKDLNFELAKVLINAGADIDYHINTMEYPGTTYLMHILSSDNPHKIKHLFIQLNGILSLGADINAQDNNGNSALIYLVNTIIDYFGIYDEREANNLLQYLIKNGANPYQDNNQGKNAITILTSAKNLSNAVRKSYLKILESR